MRLKSRNTLILIGSMLTLIGIGVFLWISDQQKPGVKKVYKVVAPAPLVASPPIEPAPDHPYLHREAFIRGLKAEFKNDPRIEKFIAFLESEAGEEFLSRNPSLEEINTKRESFLPKTKRRLTREQMKAQWYADMLPAGKSMEEIEQDMLNYISEVIREKGFHLEDPTDGWHRFEVFDIVTDHPQIFPFLSKKFQDNSWAGVRWLSQRVDELLVREHEKALSSNNTASTEPQGDPSETTAAVRKTGFTEAVATDINIPEPLKEIPASETATATDAETTETLTKQPLPQQPTMWLDPKMPLEQRTVIALNSLKLPPKQHHAAMRVLMQYEPEEGLRHLKETNPAVAKQIEEIIQRPKPK